MKKLLFIFFSIFYINAHAVLTNDFSYVENGITIESRNAEGNWFFRPTNGVLTGDSIFNSSVDTDFIGICPACTSTNASLVISKSGDDFTLNSFNFSGFGYYRGGVPPGYTFRVQGYNDSSLTSPTGFDSGNILVTGYSDGFGTGFHPQLVTLANGTYKYLAITTENGATDCLCVASFDFGNINFLENALFSAGPSGPSAADTQSSMQYQSRQLRSAFNTQTVAANFALNYDCTLFDAKGMCISAGGRYTTIDNPNINNSAAVVTLGYKVNPNIRIGGYLDQNINISNPTGINISNNTPLMGLYAVWNKEQSGLGYQVRLANTYQDKDVTSTRTVFDTSEAGSGKSSLQSQSYLAELSYAFQYQDKTLVRPYAGLRYTHLKQDGYTEGSVDNPLTLASLRDKSATALLGVKVNRSLTDKATLTAQLGLEQDVHHKVDNYSGTNSDIGDLDAVAFNSNIKRTRPVASLGAFYDVTKTQRASATINYQQTPFQSTGSTTAYFNYMIGF